MHIHIDTHTRNPNIPPLEICPPCLEFMNTALHLPLSPAVLSSSTKLALQRTDTLNHNTQLFCTVIITAPNGVASNYIHCTSLIAGSRERTCTQVPATAFCSDSSVHCTVHTQHAQAFQTRRSLQIHLYTVQFIQSADAFQPRRSLQSRPHGALVQRKSITSC